MTDRRPGPRLLVRPRAERGASSVELVLYLPVLMMIIFIGVQAALLYLGNAAAGAAAREAARVARAGRGQSPALGEALRRGREFALDAGSGVLDDPQVSVRRTGIQEVTVTVTGRGVVLVPGVPGGTIRQTVVSPFESFRADA